MPETSGRAERAPSVGRPGARSACGCSERALTGQREIHFGERLRLARLRRRLSAKQVAERAGNGADDAPQPGAREGSWVEQSGFASSKELASLIETGASAANKRR